MNLIFLGPPGVGKGTQALQVAAYAKLAHVATGDILRAAVKAGTKTGLEARSYMDSGRLVPDEVVNRLVRERLEEKDTQGGVLFDGYPRTPAQAQSLDAALRELGRKISGVFDFQAPDAVLVERISGRRTCGKCQKAYHVKFAPSKAGESCETCGGALVQRSDDKPETVQKRLDVYRKDTAGVGDHYRKAGVYQAIAADGPIGAITEDVLARVKRLA
ncbi:MAG: adenylate kinase [Planctomycetes bacterium]|nr:adenylate kinase [Planctomycetota bacterium]